MTGTDRIRWERNGDGDILMGYVGSRPGIAFRIYAPDHQNCQWLLSVRLIADAKFIYASDRDEAKAIPELKAEAERWLEEFVTSLGAAFPAGSSDEDEAEPQPAKRPALTSMYVFDALYSAGFTPWGGGEPGFTTGWYMDAITVDHVGADLPVHGPLEGPRAIVAGYARTLDEAGFDTHVTVNTVLVRKKAAANPAPAGEENPR